MEKYNREELKAEAPEIIHAIQQAHEPQEAILIKELFEDRTPVRGLTHIRGHFMILGPFFVQYTMENIITNVEQKLIGRRVTEVILYETFQEYEAARILQLQSVPNDKQTGLNHN